MAGIDNYYRRMFDTRYVHLKLDFVSVHLSCLYILTFDRTDDGQTKIYMYDINYHINFDKVLIWLVQKKYYMLKSSAEKIRHILFSYLFCRVEGKATNHENVAAG